MIGRNTFGKRDGCFCGMECQVGWSVNISLAFVSQLVPNIDFSREKKGEAFYKKFSINLIYRKLSLIVFYKFRLSYLKSDL